MAAVAPGAAGGRPGSPGGGGPGATALGAQANFLGVIPHAWAEENAEEETTASGRAVSKTSGVSRHVVGTLSTASRAIPGCMAHCGYYALAFFAYWFGAARFDANGDGEFDAADVQRMINDIGLHLRFSFSRPVPRGHRLQEMKQNRARRIESELEAKRARRRRSLDQTRELSEVGRARASSGNPLEAAGEASRSSRWSGSSGSSVKSALAIAGERVRHSFDAACDTAAQVVVASVEPDSECVEETIQDNLRQYLPWFTILQVCACFGLWLGYASQTNQYVVLAEHVSVDDVFLVGKFSGISIYECHIECSHLGDACWGVAFLHGPATQCKLLSAVSKEEYTTGSWNCGDAEGCCREGAWNWQLSEKQPRTLGSLFGTIGGLETAFPGQTALQSFRYCEEGFEASIFWRLLSYQYTHIDVGHVGSNCLMLILLGVPLEGFHGTGLAALMYTIGVAGGGLAWMLLDPYTVAVGASGGGYALLGMHFADLVLNWKQKKFRYSEALLLATVMAAETACSFPSVQDDTSSTARSVHAGGLVSGVLVGMVLTRNIDNKRWELGLQGFALLVGTGLVCFCLAWWSSSPLPGVRSLWSGGEGPLCWIGQVCTNTGNTGCDYNTGWQCVACSTRECVENWYKDMFYFCVTRGSPTTCDGNFANIVHNCQNC
ncbi:unnamed protein product [Prorocentrum cordatum]|uniref:Peptidase S54 rhomboid domain-containing protein n=1 Tax=Prorocentrum cordatum TaxID=2364126 RepID=A0ABN9WJT6_9DINO|nr:unnamed protein product [Polarella glacialis]